MGDRLRRTRSGRTALLAGTAAIGVAVGLILGAGVSRASAADAPPPASPPAAAPAPATATGAADPVVAIVDGTSVHRSQLERAHEQGQQAGEPLAAVYDQELDQLIAGQLLLNEAHKNHLESDPAVKQDMQDAQDQVLEQAYILKRVDAGLDEATVKQRYQAMVATQPGGVEVHARHILLASEADAVHIIAELKGGAKFEDLAKAQSKDPSAASNGGDLGFFSKDQMVPEFANAAFAMKDGEVSKAPVKSQFGWHVIQVLEHRQVPPPSYDDVKARLMDQMRSERAHQVMGDLKTAAKVERFKLDGSKP